MVNFYYIYGFITFMGDTAMHPLFSINMLIGSFCFERLGASSHTVVLTNILAKGVVGIKCNM